MRNVGLMNKLRRNPRGCCPASISMTGELMYFKEETVSELSATKNESQRALRICDLLPEKGISAVSLEGRKDASLRIATDKSGAVDWI